MSSFGDYAAEMSAPRPFDDTTADQLLAGRAPVDPDLALVAAFVEDMRAAAGGPLPPPSPALAAVFASGLPVQQLATTVAEPADAARPAAPAGPARRSARRLVPRWGAKLAGATLLAKAGLGLSVAAASVTGAAAAGVPVARDVVEAVTPVEFPDPRARPEHRRAGPGDEVDHGRGATSGSDDARRQDQHRVVDDERGVNGERPSSPDRPRARPVPAPAVPRPPSSVPASPPARQATPAPGTPSGAATAGHRAPDAAPAPGPARGDDDSVETPPPAATDGEQSGTPEATTSTTGYGQRQGTAPPPAPGPLS